MNPINALEFIHLGKGEAQMFQPLDELEALKVGIGIDPFTPLHSLDRIEEADLFIVPNRAGTHAHQVS